VTADVDGMCFVNGEGETVEFPFLESDGERLLRGGHILERIGQHHFRVHPPADLPSWEFRFERDAVARPCALFVEGATHPPVRLQYDKGLLAFIQVDGAKRVAFEYAGQRPTCPGRRCPVPRPRSVRV
jgi:hypothetical protein